MYGWIDCRLLYSPERAWRIFAHSLRCHRYHCHHDDGILYANKLREAGVGVTLNETKGTMHGFDIMQKSETAKKALVARIEFMKKVIENGE